MRLVREEQELAERPKPVVIWPATHQQGACMRMVRLPLGPVGSPM
jgi:hypothetical protein